MFQPWKQKGTFNPLRLYYELGLKTFSVTCENKQTPLEQKYWSSAVCVCAVYVCLSSFDINVCLAEEMQLLRGQSINNGEIS